MFTYKINFEKVIDSAKVPGYVSENDQFFSLFAAEDAHWAEILEDGKVIGYGVDVRTGLIIKVPKAYRIDFFGRKDWAKDYHVQILNSVEKIYSGKIDEVVISLRKLGSQRSLPEIKKGSIIAIGELNQVIRVSF